ncbi:Qat anti-phage system QueC-like protein QatC [Paenibacillus sp. EC2-1]|uniref:Qat anti-phage system QueC-like protein QatC n=1 Tax=Paenibacillus sp. EC2-1 TaxID=3388665 RepID=UPI003BEF278E
MNIICKMTNDDDFTIDEQFIEYNISKSDTFTYTFWRTNTVKKFLNLPNFFSTMGLDFLYISLFVYGADRIISRKMGYDAWSREITLYVPILEFEKWNNNKVLVEKLLNYLSGDKWNLEFRQRELTKTELKIKTKVHEIELNNKISVKRISMFSGGLDSFIGAIDALEVEKDNILFVSHYGGGKGVKEYQDKLGGRIRDKYIIGDERFFTFHAAARSGVEDTTRTRSFMFFCHAVAVATCFNNPIELLIPENGLISLNIPLTNSRLGSSSTRTTHPYYLGMFQTLLNNSEVEVTISNPYQFSTKGEMILSCNNFDFLSDNISETMSCSHPDQGRLLRETKSRHCGSCLPCVIRRASIKRAGIKDTTSYRDTDYSIGDVSRINHNSYQIGLSKFDEKYAFLNIQKSGPITSEIDKYTDLYIRGMNELREVLNN